MNSEKRSRFVCVEMYCGLSQFYIQSSIYINIISIKRYRESFTYFSSTYFSSFEKLEWWMLTVFYCVSERVKGLEGFYWHCNILQLITIVPSKYCNILHRILQILPHIVLQRKIGQYIAWLTEIYCNILSICTGNVCFWAQIV